MATAVLCGIPARAATGSASIAAVMSRAAPKSSRIGTADWRLHVVDPSSVPAMADPRHQIESSLTMPPPSSTHSPAGPRPAPLRAGRAAEDQQASSSSTRTRTRIRRRRRCWPRSGPRWMDGCACTRTRPRRSCARSWRGCIGARPHTSSSATARMSAWRWRSERSWNHGRPAGRGGQPGRARSSSTSPRAIRCIPCWRIRMARPLAVPLAPGFRPAERRRT